MRRALRRLPVDLQITIELHYWEEMELEDIGKVLEIPGGTVKSRLFRARKLLREQVEQLEAGDALRESTVRDLDGWMRSMRRRAKAHIERG